MSHPAWVWLSHPRHWNMKKWQKWAKTLLTTRFFFTVTAPKHDVCFLARFREPSCVELFLIYLPIFLRSLRIKNRRFWIVFISVDLIKKLTKKSQFLPHFQKFRKSVDFEEKSRFLTKFHFELDFSVFDKKLDFFQWKLRFSTFQIF